MLIKDTSMRRTFQQHLYAYKLVTRGVFMVAFIQKYTLLQISDSFN